MSMAVLEAQAGNIPPVCAFDVVRFEQPASDKLQAQLGEAVDKINKVLSEGTRLLLAAPTLDDFQETRKKIFPIYIKLSMAMSNIAIAMLDPSECAQLSQISYGKLEEEFQQIGLAYLGEQEYKEALFSLSTLKSAQRWVPHLLSVPPGDSVRDKENELARKFSLNSLWAQVHLDCLLMAIRTRATISAELLQEILSGLRSSVMAYAAVREALDLRSHFEARYKDPVEWGWDAEDESLANAK